MWLSRMNDHDHLEKLSRRGAFKQRVSGKCVSPHHLCRHVYPAITQKADEENLVQKVLHLAEEPSAQRDKDGAPVVQSFADARNLTATTLFDQIKASRKHETIRRSGS